MIGVLIFKEKAYEGTLLNSSQLINSTGYNKLTLLILPKDL
jgi:hypothetical protein